MHFGIFSGLWLGRRFARVINSVSSAIHVYLSVFESKDEFNGSILWIILKG